MLTIGRDELRSVLPMPRAVDVLAEAFADRADVRSPLRQHMPAGDGALLLMPAAGERDAGVKLVTINPANPPRDLPLVSGVYVLFADDLLPAAVIDGSALTSLRTAAVSALATRALARPDASRLVVFGTGAQAASHVEAMRAVRPIGSVRVVGRSSGKAEAFARSLRADGVDASPATPDAVAAADIVCTCTSSPRPVLDGTALAAGAHVNAIGSYQPETRELDDATLARGRLVVEDREAVFTESGDVIIPRDRGTLHVDDVAADLAEVVRGAKVRESDDDITLFKSVGLALEDLVLARAALGGASR